MSWKVESWNTTEAWGRQPTGKVSPTTAHWGGTGIHGWARLACPPSGCPKPRAKAVPALRTCPPPLPSPGAPPPEPAPSPGRAGAPPGGTSLGGRGTGGGGVRAREGQGVPGSGPAGKGHPVCPPSPRGSASPTTAREGRWGRTLVGVGLPDALGRLEGVEGVGEVHVWVRLVHQPVQHVYSLQDGHSLVREAPELGVLARKDGVSRPTGGAGPMHGRQAGGRASHPRSCHGGVSRIPSSGQSPPSGACA